MGNMENKKIIEILLKNNITTSELINLKWSNVDFSNMTIILKDRIVNISWEVRNALFELKGWDKSDNELVVS